MGPFESRGLYERKGRKRYPVTNGEMMNGTFICGMDVVVGNDIVNDSDYNNGVWDDE